jgi:hypothetical protein
LNRKTSLLRIVPTACGQAADIALPHAAPRAATFIALRRDHVAMLGDCASIATLRHDRLSERSYLFTMSDITHPREAFWLLADAKNVSLRTSQSPTGGARRDRTDDLLLAKQALSQLSYGPSRYRGSEVSNREEACAPDHRSLKVVGLGRFELPTSRLSSARSNQLSYKPLGQETVISDQKSVMADQRPGTSPITDF